MLLNLLFFVDTFYFFLSWLFPHLSLLLSLSATMATAKDFPEPTAGNPDEKYNTISLDDYHKPQLPCVMLDLDLGQDYLMTSSQHE